MKKILLYFTLVLSSILVIASCDTLDIENIYSYDADKVWNDEKLADAFLVNLYANTFENWNIYADEYSDQVSGIKLTPDFVTVTNKTFKVWNYENIRAINECIENAQAGQLPDEIKKSIIAQAKFLRAYAYFNMVKVHGGVPYITVPQHKGDDLKVARNTSAECFDFIIKDLDESNLGLPECVSKSSDSYGRIDQCFNRAFKARVLLYKASPQFNPTKPWDNKYWNDAYNASKQAYEMLKSHGYALVDDYANLFLEEKGPEVVFAVINQYPNKTANWDYGARPGSLSRGNAAKCPTWEFVKAFPMLDGKNWNDPTSKYYVEVTEGDKAAAADAHNVKNGVSAEDIAFVKHYWENRDPRFAKSIIWNASDFSIAGTPSNRKQYTSLGIAHELDDFGTNPEAKVNCTHLDYYSGFFIRKAVQISHTQAETQKYDVDYNVMRFAEVMLNYAESANEAGHPEIAKEMLRAIRHRAGIEKGDGDYGMDLSSRESIRMAILNERNIEFCFEGFRFWDVRRLRMLDIFNNTTKHGVEAIAIDSNGKDVKIIDAKKKADKYELQENDFRYVIHQIPFSGVKVNTIKDNYYFFPIKKSSILANSNLIQNKGWDGGTFDPVL